MQLPDAILTRVFQFATQNLRKDFFTYITVCMKWRRSSQQYPVLQFVRPNFNKIGNRACLALSESCKRLRFLFLHECRITDTGLHALTKLSSLFELALDYLPRSTAVTSDGLQALGALTQLKVLCLSGVCHTEQHGINLAFVTKFKCLRKLRVYASKITDTGLEGLAGTSSLTELYLLNHASGFSYTMPVLLRVMKHLHELQDLALSNEFSGRGLVDVGKVVQTLPKPHVLRTLRLQGFDFVDVSTALALRDGCTGLSALAVDSCYMTDNAFRSHVCTSPSICLFA